MDAGWKNLREACKELKKACGKEDADSALVKMERFDENRENHI